MIPEAIIERAARAEKQFKADALGGHGPDTEWFDDPVPGYAIAHQEAIKERLGAILGALRDEGLISFPQDWEEIGHAFHVADEGADYWSLCPDNSPDALCRDDEGFELVYRRIVVRETT